MSRTRYAVRPGVAVVDDGLDGDAAAPVFVACLPSGPLLVLEGTAALAWRAMQMGRDVVATVALQTGADPTEIRPEVEDFLDALAHRGLLERPEGQASADR